LEGVFRALIKLAGLSYIAFGQVAQRGWDLTIMKSLELIDNEAMCVAHLITGNCEGPRVV